VSADSLLKVMNSQQQQLWKDRTTKQIVLVDDESKLTATQISLPLMTLKDVIYKVCVVSQIVVAIMLCI